MSVEQAPAPVRPTLRSLAAADTACADSQRPDAGKFALLVLELVLLTALLVRFNLETPAFRQLTLLAFGGFCVHYFLPRTWRLPFFLVLSLAGFTWVLGAAPAAWVIALGAGLIGICHLSVSFRVRTTLLLVAGGVLLAQRVNWLPAPWSISIWPVLASMFMFRLIVYMYDLHHRTQPTSPMMTLSYFFLLPNVCFPLFPVVDYRTFCQTYYAGDRHDTYQTGVRWIFRGITHLIAYRFVYYHLMTEPSAVRDFGDLVRYLLAGFLLYLRVSGQFHIIVGMLHLFGFDLPETNHRYLLSAGFSDFWRRINIYWKDFMLKVFYYPAYFRFRKRGTTFATLAATFFVFVVTWALHSYQWLWLRGSPLLSATDALFWTALALLVAVNLVVEDRFGRVRAIGAQQRTIKDDALLVLRTFATLATICTLWSMWNSESVASWLALMATAGTPSRGDRWLWAGFALGAVLLAVAVLVDVRQDASRLVRKPVRFWRSGATTAALMAACFTAGIPAVYMLAGPRVATFAQNLQSTKLNRLDAGLMERGYYENLVAVDRFNSQLWEVYANRPADWMDQQVVTMARPTGDFLQRELSPSTSFLSSGARMTTNRWGMRDKEYDLMAAEDTYRIAVLGPSFVMGQGVENDNSFEAVLERRLNEQLNGDLPDPPHRRYEVLNFGVSGYRPLQHLLVLEQKVARFEPNAVFYCAHGGEPGSNLVLLAEVVRGGVEIPFEYVAELVRTLKLKREMTRDEIVRRLAPHRDELARWINASVVAACREQGAVPVWIYVPMPGEDVALPERGQLIQAAKDAGFLCFDLTGCYDGHAVEEYSLASYDLHPNALGHRLIANGLYAEIKQAAALFANPPSN